MQKTMHGKMRDVITKRFLLFPRLGGDGFAGQHNVTDQARPGPAPGARRRRK